MRGRYSSTEQAQDIWVSSCVNGVADHVNNVGREGGFSIVVRRSKGGEVESVTRIEAKPILQAIINTISR